MTTISCSAKSAISSGTSSRVLRIRIRLRIRRERGAPRGGRQSAVPPSLRPAQVHLASFADPDPTPDPERARSAPRRTTISCSAKSATSSGTSSQCCGSGSESGSVCFWASWIRIHLSEAWIRIRSILSSSINNKKTLDSYCFVTSF
jgi:hypothetical protein